MLLGVLRGVWLVIILTCFVERSEFNANSVDPDQTPRSVASDLGLHYLPMSHLWDARHKWVKNENMESNNTNTDIVPVLFIICKQ